jgi:anion-transporting  ArsA/GET3 family ATPase
MSKRQKQQHPGTVTETPMQENQTPMSETKTAPEAISSEDLSQLLIKYKDFQIASMQQKLAVQELEKAVESARSELVKLNDAVNQKYHLDPAKDKINLQDGTITRG